MNNSFIYTNLDSTVICNSFIDNDSKKFWIASVVCQCQKYKRKKWTWSDMTLLCVISIFIICTKLYTEYNIYLSYQLTKKKNWISN